MTLRILHLALIVIILAHCVQTARAAERKVLAEMFTSSTCGYCAGANPYFDDWLNFYEHRANVSVIKYHVWWPSPGNDPFYANNPDEVEARDAFYNNSYAPHMFIDGSIDGGSSAAAWPDLIDNRMTQASPFIIRMLGNITQDGGTVRIRVISDGTPIPSGTLTLRVAVVESNLAYRGTNGEPIHHFVMQKMLPDAAGQAITVALNDSAEFTRTVESYEYFFFENASIVAFIQQSGTRTVLQSEMRTLTSLLPPAPAVLVSPQHQSVNLPAQPLFLWRNDASALGYRVQISTDSTFTTISVEDSTLTDTMFTSPALAPGTTHFWRVQTRSDNGWGSYSSAYSFTLMPAPTAPALTFPPDATPGQRVRAELQWTACPTALRYRVQVASDPGFGTVVADATDLAGQSYRTAPLAGMTTYYWRAAGANEGGWSEWSPVFSFVTEAATSVQIATLQRWNMISVPVDVGQIEPSALFPGITSPAYRFAPGNGYAISTSVEHGGGYWLKFAEAQSVTIEGAPLAQDTVAVQQGWNIVGSLSSSASTASVSTEPAGLLSGSWYEYDGGYRPSTSIRPGAAYWVKAGGEGLLFLNAAPAQSPVHSGSTSALEGSSSLTISDASGSSQTLFLAGNGRTSISARSYELPPPAPAGAFDVRFAGDGLVADAALQSPVPILISGGVYPVTVSWNMRDADAGWHLVLDGIEVPLTGSSGTSIDHAGGQVAVRHAGQGSIPEAFLLHQNYPNPFNPSTMIRYEVPVDARITLRIFDVMGRAVATLADGVQGAGYNVLSWDGTDARGMSLSSGTYFLRLEATGLAAPGNHVIQTRRMFLIR